ncbi:MAG: transcription-repair coupling factor [Bacteroidales bacterium]|nr:transcription-repair coupling factor [Bacteroidales bacterium]
MLLTEKYYKSSIVKSLLTLADKPQARIHIDGLVGSLPTTICATIAVERPTSSILMIAPSKEEAYYLLNDIESLLGETDADLEQKRALLFPTTYRKPYQSDEVDNANVLQRSEVVRQLSNGRKLIVVTYPDALCEKIISKTTLKEHTLEINRGGRLDIDFVMDMLQEYDFERTDFVVEPGQFAVRGGIIDVFSYADEHPYRIEFYGEEIDSLRTFDPVTQLSIKQLDSITILPNLDNRENAIVEQKVPLVHYFGSQDMVWMQGLMFICETIEKGFATARQEYEKKTSPIAHLKPEELYCSANEFLKLLLECKIIEYGNSVYFTKAERLKCSSEVQPTFNKQFDLLEKCLNDYTERGYEMMIGVTNEKQRMRLEKLFDEGTCPACQLVDINLNHGFIDHDEHLLCFTDHEIFERYHKYTVHDLQNNREALTLKELFELKPGDFVTHIDYGVGRFSGLEKIDNNGKEQEVIRLTYKNNDTLYISIHGLHKISRYVGKEGVAPTLSRLGSSSWQVLKQKTKKQVKDIARDLIALYAKRRASKGFAFSADSYLQNELEASFFYEDTPDQYKATRDVKHDMESTVPMDRLICGDVGFGKTEVAIRAAFKAVCDSKQVAVLVPATILAFQHYNTFCERLKGMPVRVDYLNRFRTTKEKNQIFKDVESGKIDILIGTHAILNKNLKFHDLGLLIIDEEQKFGVSAKEKLRQLKVNVDCLTLTATPIPRTLQFSMMGARDLSVIQTPPPNRQPIETELSEFNETLILDAITYELSRGGQVFFINNRVENLTEIAGMINRLVPDASVAIGHGQMDGKEVEEVLMRFMEGEIDILVATSIIENGLDIPNANTMIINNAQNFGLSDLHQMRGRVGRSNKKAFCYLMIPGFSMLTEEAQKRLRAIEEFSTIGSGFNIAMRDLDIRGAGNILGAEQSGFISDIGYDMYQKILDEAIEELKETDFADLFYQEAAEKKEYVRECLIETDLEVLIPDHYVTNISQRLLLYKQLNDITTDEDLDQYREQLIDRFGPVPQSTQELILTIKLRRIAKEFGIEKLALRQDKMVCFFVANQDNPFYKSTNFSKMIRFASAHPQSVHLKETKDRLSLVCDNIKSIYEAIECLRTLVS